jgi:arylsulfatase A-like enzyme
MREADVVSENTPGRGAWLAALLLGLAWLIPACSEQPESAWRCPREDGAYCLPGANLILISIDTLRADRLGCYGYASPTSPAIDRLAARGVRFAQAIAETSWTLPSHMTLMTGLYPTTHGVTTENRALAPEIPTLAEVLRARGYRAYGNTSGGFVGGWHGFARGFETYQEEEEPFKKTLWAARLWMEDLEPGERFFAFLHTYDVHCPYNPPRRYRKLFGARPESDHIETRGRCGNPHYNSMSLTPGQAAFLSDAYDAGIRAADDALKDFIRYLNRRSDFEKTIVVLLSDHGEEFKEHGQIGHERTLYMESLRVPLLIVAPGLEPRVVEEIVGLADVLPTLLEMLGVEAPTVQGRSLLPLMAGSESPWQEKLGVSELDRHVELRSIASPRYHFIMGADGQRRELYDLQADPEEQNDLAALLTEQAKQLEEELGLHLDGIAKPQKVPEVELSPEQRERLKALGYMQ